MVAEMCVVIYGVRIELTEAEIESCETRQHPLIVSSRLAGLQHYWSNFGLPGERFLLFVGFQMAIMGLENSLRVEYSDDEILETMRSTG